MKVSVSIILLISRGHEMTRRVIADSAITDV